eukprot:CAMPEP_0181294366 /NCGR_PEP_ID=MMETSP1101-20121128/3561_1 /TAXON_ID=46948 /ORGANISM="Rhodomonas abbreviata, Strain Caron Lab Isolate" /LENGTH=613 /DNA_ID=CAMNT_0023399017 /DNA_START=180 /DNA_END=2017 /DNA_ORIENTATION=+
MQWGLSCDLVSASKDHRNLLRAVHSCGKELYHPGTELDRAIEMYKTWLPKLFLAMDSATGIAAPPVDVAWVWHLHKLDPVSYASDCQAAFGLVVHPPTGVSPFCYAGSPTCTCTGHEETFSEEHVKPPKESQVGRRKRGRASNVVAASCQAFSISCDIKECAKRQSTFLWQVRSANYEDKEFLDAAVLRYVMMLGLMRKYPGKFIVPTYDQDLIWHTHLAFPQHYAADCDKFVGRLVNHDDSVNNRDKGSKLNVSTTSTRKLFESTYGCAWEKAGGMYRGEPPEWYWEDRALAITTHIPAVRDWFRPLPGGCGLASLDYYDPGAEIVAVAGAAFGHASPAIPMAEAVPYGQGGYPAPGGYPGQGYPGQGYPGQGVHGMQHPPPQANAPPPPYNPDPAPAPAVPAVQTAPTPVPTEGLGTTPDGGIQIEGNYYYCPVPKARAVRTRVDGTVPAVIVPPPFGRPARSDIRYMAVPHPGIEHEGKFLHFPMPTGDYASLVVPLNVPSNAFLVCAVDLNALLLRKRVFGLDARRVMHLSFFFLFLPCIVGAIILGQRTPNFVDGPLWLFLLGFALFIFVFLYKKGGLCFAPRPTGFPDAPPLPPTAAPVGGPMQQPA